MSLYRDDTIQKPHSDQNLLTLASVSYLEMFLFKMKPIGAREIS